MGINVRLETETGSPIEQVTDFDRRVVLLVREAQRDAQSRCLAFVDPFGDTTFNQLQVPTLIDETRRAASAAPTEATSIAGQIVALATKALASPHLYVKFVGE